MFVLFSFLAEDVCSVMVRVSEVGGWLSLFLCSCRKVQDPMFDDDKDDDDDDKDVDDNNDDDE